MGAQVDHSTVARLPPIPADRLRAMKRQGRSNYRVTDAAVSLGAFRQTGRKMTVREAREAARQFQISLLPLPTPQLMLTTALADVMDERDGLSKKARRRLPQIGRGSVLMAVECKLAVMAMNAPAAGDEDLRIACARAGLVVREMQVRRRNALIPPPSRGE